jgi:ribosomal-protein-alanine N-acetyltransferase
MSEISFTPFPKLSTKNYNLRRLVISDDAKIFILRSDERVLEYLGKPKAKSIYEAREFIDKINNGIENNEWIMWVIETKESSTFIGTICLWNLSDDKSKADIGFEILPDYFGKGIMQEIIPIILDFGFIEMNLDAIEGEVDPRNIKSIKLMKKFGFDYSDELENTIIYSLPKEKFRNKN